jgi:hypothetical protein
VQTLVERRLALYRYGLYFVLGIATTLAATSLAGDLALNEMHFPFGWAVLWLVSFIGCLPLGVVMLVGPVWRTLPLTRRRGTALGYLAVGLVDLATLAGLTSLTLGSSGPLLWLLVVVYALGLVAAIVATQPPGRRGGEEIFP